jgi:hypothetical protein
MKNELNIAKRFYVIFIALLCYSTAASADYIEASLINPFDSGSFTRKNPAIHVKQRLPVGDTMRATVTANNVIIKNKDGTIPEYQGTVPRGEEGISFTLPGIANGKVVTDIHQQHTDPSIGTGILEVAAFKNGQGFAEDVVEAVGLGEWLSTNGYTESDALTVPDFMASSDIFYGVDLSIWGPGGFSVNDSLLGQTFIITNGRSAALPGFLFGTSALFAGANGWETASRFSGTVTLDSYHEFSVPEPTSAALFGLGTFALIGLRKSSKNTRSTGASAGSDA